MRALNRREHDYQIPVKDAIWASDERFASSEESKVGDRSTRRRMAGHFWKALARIKWVGKSEFLGYGRQNGSGTPMRKERPTLI